LERAQKLGILSLSEHGLTTIPSEIFAANLAPLLKTLDLSKNQLDVRQILQQEHQLLLTLINLKTLNLDYNTTPSKSSKSTHGGGKKGKPVSSSGSRSPAPPSSTVATHSAPAVDWRKWNTLQNLSLAGNRLGQQPSDQASSSVTRDNASDHASILPILPPSLKSLNLASNQWTRVPGTLLLRQYDLPLLQVLNLSDNQLTILPDEMFAVVPLLQELRLDDNQLTCIPHAMGQTLKQLKILSVRNNQLQMTPTATIPTNNANKPRAPLPASLFTDTALVDLNLHGNTKLSHTLLSSMDGYDVFCERRRLVKQKTMSNMDNCGLD
jgi:Leucine-rich repeat (LRR) protein